MITVVLLFSGVAALFRFSVVVPGDTPDGDQPITATYNRSTTRGGTLFAIQP
jgi:hypothetical protein